MEKRVLDYILVPLGLLAMVGYHAWLLYRIMKHPTKTVIGINAINRRFWVRAMMEDVSKNGVLSVQTLRNNIMASTLLASMAIMLSSVTVLMTSGSKGDTELFVFGDRGDSGYSVKYFCILACFLVAFLFSVQSIRYYSHASILINVPFQKISQDHDHHQLTVEFVARNVNRGSFFWSLGLRAFYFSFPLFLWIFGPIPMFVSCFVLVSLDYFLDVTFDCGWVVGVSDDDHPKDEEPGMPN
ncbi:hypothetical protein PanWU01x14_067620 [Parasponia andersonii]|uniref:DUF599 domain-containing protein n=1 Tax=Parasponia andersonii TaxID=3476 RepID=A0A2P5DF82_PARAD|nr:hypothetical protein PanWU01x14_067620 [Parasponia andersonii]